MFTHLSKNNPYHLYSINHDKIIRDDYLMDFQHPDLIKCDYIPLPNLTYSEVKAIIIDLRMLLEFRDMVIAFYFNIEPNGKTRRIPLIREGDKTERVKELLKFIKRTDSIVI